MTTQIRLAPLAAALALAFACAPGASAPILCPGKWQQVAGGDEGPPPRSYTSMAYDEARQRVVLFGGIGKPGETLGDTWEWDGQAWSQRADAGPAPLLEAMCTYANCARGATSADTE